MSRGKLLVNNTVMLGIGSILPKMTQFIVLPIYTSMLTKAEYGTYDLINILGSLLTPLVTLQIERAAFRFLIDNRDNEDNSKIISNIYIFVTLMSTIVLVLLGFILNSIRFNIRILILAYLFVNILISVTRQVVRGLGNNKSYSISAIMQSIINMLLAVLFLRILNWGLPGLIISLCIAILIPLTYLFSNRGILRQIRISCFDKANIKEMLKYSLPMVPNSVSLWVVSLSDRIIITAFLGIEVNAIYAIANKFPNLVTLLYNNFNMAWQESASLSLNDKDYQDYYSRVLDKLYDFLIGITAVLIVTTPILFSLLIRGNYDEAYYQIPILYLGAFFSTISSYYGGIYVALKNTKHIGYSSVIAAALNMGINLLFIKKFGIYVASISTLLSYFILVVYRVFDIKKIISIQYKWKRIALYLALVVIMAIVNYQRILMLDIFNFILGYSFAFVINRRLALKLMKGLLKRFRSKYARL